MRPEGSLMSTVVLGTWGCGVGVWHIRFLTRRGQAITSPSPGANTSSFSASWTPLGSSNQSGSPRLNSRCPGDPRDTHGKTEATPELAGLGVLTGGPCLVDSGCVRNCPSAQVPGTRRLT